ncbi:hypothetical protein EVAR_51744_1 [Eumeta japonica]|uniref:Uncharacterized protein n=1 Tax=Eumeta variegata TaxID=151549 RepID=A0A4C1XKI2_EUMVA|nr:hypothetical protein EVAR_51744_1 [Eumeta japonica]
MRARRGTRPFHSGMVSPPKSERDRHKKVKGTRPFHSDRNKLRVVNAVSLYANVLQVIIEQVQPQASHWPGDRGLLTTPPRGDGDVYGRRGHESARNVRSLQVVMSDSKLPRHVNTRQMCHLQRDVLRREDAQSHTIFTAKKGSNYI